MDLRSRPLRVFPLLYLALAAVLIQSCGSSGPPPPHRKQVSKVTGRVTVDGKTPAIPIQIECVVISQKDPDPAHFSASTAGVNEDGTFAMHTYEADDGMPDGEYGLCFSSREFNLMQRQMVGPDKLKGRYSDKKSPFKTFKVEGQPVDLGEIQLSTK